MHRTRLMGLPMLAGTLGVALLGGCPNAGTLPPLPGTPTTAATASSSTGTAAASVAPSATPSATASSSTGGTSNTPASAAPSAATSSSPSTVVSAPPAPTGATTILAGDVYDENVATVDGATVTIKSLDAAHPYNVTLTASAGHYVANDVPVGVQVQVTATKTNWTSRSRVSSFVQNSGTQNTMNFGGAYNNAADAGGAAFFISKYPEISATVPDTDTINGKHLSYLIRVSEPLDADNQRRLANSLTISADARPGSLTQIQIKTNSTFLSTNRKASATWNADGTEMTVTLDAPLQQLRSDRKTYAATITRGSGDSPITDKNNNVLGLTTPAASSAYSAAIKLASLVLTGKEVTGADRWNSTHTKSSGFDVMPDAVNPTVASVSGTPVTVNGVDKERIEITFSKPALVFPDVLQTDNTLGASDTGTTSGPMVLANYAFAISDTSVTGVDMKKVLTNGITVTSATTASTMLGYMNGATPFRVDNSKLNGNAMGHVQVSTTNPNVIQFDILRAIWPIQAKYVRVRVEPTWTDPSGNRMSEANQNADLTADNVKDGTLQ